MNREAVIACCAAKPAAVDTYPFGDGVLVFKVGGRMFALVSLDGERGSVSLKCLPELAVVLRSSYPAVRAGYHLNKRHWNTIELDDSLPADELTDMIAHSYDLVVSSLSRKVRASLRS